MKCPRCNFENIPGKTRCFKCNSILEIPDAKTVNVYPPRMPRWKKPFRTFFRKIRSQHWLPNIDLNFYWNNHPELKKIVPLILDFIPGLGHLISGDLKKIRWLLLIWVVLVASAIFFLPRLLGFLLIGLAIAVHIFILIGHGLAKEQNSFRGRLIIASGFLILLLLVYMVVPRICLPWLTGGYITFAIPADNIERNDFFLADRNFNRSSLQRGSLVVVQPYGAEVHQQMFGQVVALPGEHIERKADCFVVGEQVLDNQKYPVPEWLRLQKVSFNISDDSYFINLEYNLHGQLNNELMHNACIYRASDIHGRAFMRWLPISKRGRF